MTTADRAAAWALAGLLLGVAAAAPALGLLEVVATDATIAQVSATPSSSEPGPRLFSTVDKLTFSKGLTNVVNVWYAEVTSASNNTSATSVQANGATHAIADLVFGRQNAATAFATVRAVGAFDSDAASFTAPVGATKSSQGALALRSYDTAGSPDGGTLATRYWIYDSLTNTYYVDTEKDMLTGASTVNPVSKSLQLLTTYTFLFGTNAYAVSSVGASPQYVPTVNLGWPMDLLSTTNDLYVLLDPPAGVREDTWSYAIRVTAVAV